MYLSERALQRLGRLALPEAAAEPELDSMQLPGTVPTEAVKSVVPKKEELLSK